MNFPHFLLLPDRSTGSSHAEFPRCEDRILLQAEAVPCLTTTMPTALEVDKKDALSRDRLDVPLDKNAYLGKTGASADASSEAFSPELLRLYYSRLFPYEQVKPLTSWAFARARAFRFPPASCSLSTYRFISRGLSKSGLVRSTLFFMKYSTFSSPLSIDTIASVALLLHTSPLLD